MDNPSAEIYYDCALETVILACDHIKVAEIAPEIHSIYAYASSAVKSDKSASVSTVQSDSPPNSPLF